MLKTKLPDFFIPKPKEKREDFYDYESELNSLVNYINGACRLILIVGLRRVGKSSLLLVGLDEAKVPYLRFDFRTGHRTTQSFVSSLNVGISSFSERESKLTKELTKNLNGVKGINITPTATSKIRLTNLEPLTLLFDSLNGLARDENLKFVLAFDEVQLLRHLRGFDATELIGYIYDNFENLTTVLTGSEIGMLYQFLFSRVASASYQEIKLKPLSSDKAKEFLEAGFDQHGLNAPPEFINLAVEKLGGYVGWLTNLGAQVVAGKRRFEPEIIDKILRRIVVLPAQEVQTFLSQSQITGDYKAYMAVLRKLTGPAACQELKQVVEEEIKMEVEDGKLNEMTNNLRDSGFILKGDDDRYTIPDPVLAAALGPYYKYLFKQSARSGEKTELKRAKDQMKASVSLDYTTKYQDLRGQLSYWERYEKRQLGNKDRKQRPSETEKIIESHKKKFHAEIAQLESQYREAMNKIRDASAVQEINKIYEDWKDALDAMDG